jgi:hypothetical protein
MQYRIVLIDAHVIGQFNDGTGWWTASQSNHNTEDDFMMDIGLDGSPYFRKVKKMLGQETPVILSDRKPLQRGDTWHIGPENREFYVDENDHDPKTYNEALRELARSL